MGTSKGMRGERHGITTRRWEDGKVVEEDFPLDDVSDRRIPRPRPLVTGSISASPTTPSCLRARELDLDPHAVEDAISTGERPKATRREAHLPHRLRDRARRR